MRLIPQPFPCNLCGLFGLISLIGAICWCLVGASSKYWPTTTPKFVSAGIERRTNTEGGTDYAPKIEYHYSVGDRWFQGERRYFGAPSFSTEKEAQWELARYTSRKEWIIRYVPFFPSISTIDTGFAPSLLWLPLGGAFFYFASFLFAAIPRKANQTGR